MIGTARLGDVSFRLPPDALTLDFSMDTNVQQTVGGRVVQVFGATFGDLVLRGSFGEDRSRGGAVDDKGVGRSWQLAEKFAKDIRRLADKQRDLEPHRFTYTYDDRPYTDANRASTYAWDLEVYVKSLVDPETGTTIGHSTGKFSHTYELTLFVVRDRTDILIQAGADSFIERLAEGIGWQQSRFNGSMTAGDYQKFLDANSPDGTTEGWLRQELGERLAGPADGGQ